MAQNKVDNIQVNAPKDIDNKRGVWNGSTWRPYNNITEAVESIPIQVRYRSLTVPIFKAGVPTDYYWKDGVANNQLVEKLAVSNTYVLPQATLLTLGGVKVGDGLYIDEATGILGVTPNSGGGGSGSVTSVGISSSDLNISNSPITSAGNITANIKNSAVSFAKMQNVSSGVLIGRGTSGTGALNEITVGTGLALSTSNVLTATGGGSGGGGGSQTLQQTLTLGRTGDKMKITESMEIPVSAPETINAGSIWIGSGTSGGGGGGGGGITLTTTGSSGASTMVAGVLNIPVYSGGGGGSSTWGSITGTLSAQTDLNSVLLSKQAGLISGTNIKTINGNSILGSGDLTISGGGGGSGTVTSVAVTVPTGLQVVSGSPITSSGTISIGYQSGYSIPLTSTQTDWSSAYAHSQTVGNPHGSTLQQVLTSGRIGDSMKITTSMEIPTVAPSVINTGSVWVGSGTTVSTIVKSKANSLVNSTSTTYLIDIDKSSNYIILTNSSDITASVGVGKPLTSVFVRQGGLGKVTFISKTTDVGGIPVNDVTIIVKTGKTAKTETQNAVVELFYETATRIIITGDLST